LGGLGRFFEFGIQDTDEALRIGAREEDAGASALLDFGAELAQIFSGHFLHAVLCC
jgi:hypothetical protein